MERYACRVLAVVHCRNPAVRRLFHGLPEPLQPAAGDADPLARRAAEHQHVLVLAQLLLAGLRLLLLVGGRGARGARLAATLVEGPREVVDAVRAGLCIDARRGNGAISTLIEEC